MEITRKNHGKYFGFVDNKHGIFINEKNYEAKFNEYLTDVNNPKWKQIAKEGRKYTLDNFNNDSAATSLADLFNELI